MRVGVRACEHACVRGCVCVCVCVWKGGKCGCVAKVVSFDAADLLQVPGGFQVRYFLCFFRAWNLR